MAEGPRATSWGEASCPDGPSVPGSLPQPPGSGLPPAHLQGHGLKKLSSRAYNFWCKKKKKKKN